MPYFDKQRSRFVGQVIQEGKKVRRFFPTQKEAMKWEIEQAALPPVVERISSVSLLDFLTEYLEYSEQKHSKKTFDEKRFAFKQLLRSIPPDTPVQTVTRSMIFKHLQKEAKARSGNAANKDRKNLIAAWGYGAKYVDQFPPGNPCFVDRFSEERQRRYVPSERDFLKVLEQVESQQDRAMLMAYLHLGARRTEIYTLRWEDVDFAGQQIRLYTRKRRDGSLEYDHLPLTGELMAVLMEWRRQSQGGDWVFPDPETGQPYRVRRRWMPGLCKRAGVKPFGLHGIRHLTASILMQADAPLIDIRDILRHKNLSTTEKYIHRLQSVRTTLRLLEGRNPAAESASSAEAQQAKQALSEVR